MEILDKMATKIIATETLKLIAEVYEEVFEDKLQDKGKNESQKNNKVELGIEDGNVKNNEYYNDGIEEVNERSGGIEEPQLQKDVTQDNTLKDVESKLGKVFTEREETRTENIEKVNIAKASAQSSAKEWKKLHT